MEKNTTYTEVIDSFHSTFQDKVVIPEGLEKVWFLKAVGKYSFEIDSINFDEELNEFDSKLKRYTIDTLGLMMKKFYQERELSKVNKRISIVSKDLSIDGSNGSKSATLNELAKVSEDKKVVLGLITTKTPALENKEAVIARIHEAAKYIPLDRLYLSPQCGFASCEIGNKLTEEEQWDKLRLVKEIAEEVWGK